MMAGWVCAFLRGWGYATGCCASVSHLLRACVAYARFMLVVAGWDGRALSVEGVVKARQAAQVPAVDY
jgi:hypothetical protein